MRACLSMMPRLRSHCTRLLECIHCVECGTRCAMHQVCDCTEIVGLHRAEQHHQRRMSPFVQRQLHCNVPSLPSLHTGVVCQDCDCETNHRLIIVRILRSHMQEFAIALKLHRAEQHDWRRLLILVRRKLNCAVLTVLHTGVVCQDCV